MTYKNGRPVAVGDTMLNGNMQKRVVVALHKMAREIESKPVVQSQIYDSAAECIHIDDVRVATFRKKR